jgi:hypothetical protein
LYSFPLLELLFEHSFAVVASIDASLLTASAHLPYVDLHRKGLSEIALFLLAERGELFEFSPNGSK